MTLQHTRKRQILIAACSAVMLNILVAVPQVARADDGSKGKSGSKGIVIGTPIIVHDPPKKKSH